MHTYFVYMMSNGTGSTLYVGMTNNLARRVSEHQTQRLDGFVKRYRLTRLVYAEQHATARAAIAREKQIKRWSRAKKNALVETINPDWRDLSMTWL